MLRALTLGSALILLVSVPVTGRDGSPGSAREAYNAAWDDYRAGRGDAARGALERLIGAHPTYRDAYVLLAILFRDSGEPREAARVYRDLLAKRPADVDARLWRAGILLYDLRDFDAAEGEYESALGHPAADEGQRDEARRGIETVAEQREKRSRLRGERARLHRILMICVVFWVAVFGVAWFLTRRPRP